MQRRLVSLFLAWHVGAMFIGAIPSPRLDPLPALVPPRDVSDDPLASRVAPHLDAAAELFAPVPMALWRASRPLRGAVDLYLDVLNLEQRWSMFANPPTADQYLRVRYFVGSTAAPLIGPSWMATELVLPAHREDRVRTVQSFFDSSRDKALAIAIDDFSRSFDAHVDRAGTLPDPLPTDLAPVGRYFARRFERQLTADERIVRIETWYGEALNPPRGRTLTPPVREAREVALTAYYAGPIRADVPSGPYPRFGARELEADITWRLRYVEAP